MIIVTGSISAKADCLDELLALCLEHVRRSRQEPGCLSHAVYRDVENPLRLVFFEKWADREALKKHFAVRASVAFVRAARLLAVGPPTMQIYDASHIPGPSLEEK
jgi:quinol monooxygenase YgiN